VTSPLQTLIHSSLGIHSLLKRAPLKHNVIDRDKVVVPPNWDSRGKIIVLREGFDAEAVSNGWSLDIVEPPEFYSNGNTNGDISTRTEDKPPKKGAVQSYEAVIRDPSLDALQATSNESDGRKLEISSLDTQSFLATQVEVLDKIRQGADHSGMDSSQVRGGRISSQSAYDSVEGEEGRVSEHIGPVQFNMGGIQVDADDMLQRLKVNSLVLAL
jgi:dynein light intermediate chain 1, cytosolic